MNDLPLRLGVGVVLLNDENKVFVGRRIDNPKNFWQMPQGGVNEKENLLDAAKRELEEETSIKSVKFLGKTNGWLQYYLPKNLLGKIWEGKYGGQKQKWFFMKFLGNNDEINVKTQKPEFLDWKWIVSTELPKIAVEFKIEIYKKLADEIELNYKKN
tara:strand:+ start:5179 stop:5649 length:471 start_codon:yes stop_codon:yes gene_type:complete